AEAEELHGAHEQDDDHQAGPAARRGLLHQGVSQHPAHEADGEERREETEIRDEREREAAEADEAVHGQADEAAEGVLRLAGAAGGALVADADLTEADEGAQAADEAHLLRQMSQYLDDLAIHQAEVAAVERDVQIADGVQHAIEEGVTG